MKRITRQESRSPSPKTAGPSVPAENLSDVSPVKLAGQEKVNEREYVEVRREPDEEYLAVLCIRPALWRDWENTWVVESALQSQIN